VRPPLSLHIEGPYGDAVGRSNIQSAADRIGEEVSAGVSDIILQFLDVQIAYAGEAFDVYLGAAVRKNEPRPNEVGVLADVGGGDEGYLVNVRLEPHVQTKVEVHEARCALD
jgi:hypothetical protein